MSNQGMIEPDADPHPRLVQLFVDEVLVQCEVFMAAAELYDGLCEIWGGDQPSEQSVLARHPHFDITWLVAGSLLGAAAQLSKIFWGIGNQPSRPLTRQATREAYGIDDSSLLADRSLRNDIEHYDERIIEWIDQTGGGAPFINRNMGPIELVGGAQCLLGIDPQGHKIRYGFRGNEVDLIAMTDEIMELRDRNRAAQEAARNMARPGG